MFVAAICLLIQFALNIHNLTKITSEWNPATSSCTFSNLGPAAINLTAILVSDTILLFCMLVGLYRRRVTHKYGLWKTLWRQGLVWASLAIIAEVPSVTFAYLDLNAVSIVLSSIPASYILPVYAMRMYRSLYKFARYPNKYPRGPVQVPGRSLNRQRSGRRKAVKDTQNNEHRLTEFKPYNEVHI